jgi:hypothetical protein
MPSKLQLGRQKRQQRYSSNDSDSGKTDPDSDSIPNSRPYGFNDNEDNGLNDNEDNGIDQTEDTRANSVLMGNSSSRIYLPCGSRDEQDKQSTSDTSLNSIDSQSKNKRGRPRKKLRISRSTSVSSTDSIMESTEEMDSVSSSPKSSRRGHPRKKQSSCEETDGLTASQKIMPPPMTPRAPKASVCFDDFDNDSGSDSSNRASSRVSRRTRSSSQASTDSSDSVSIQGSNIRGSKIRKFTKRCHTAKDHEGIGCAAISLNHLPDYMDARDDKRNKDARQKVHQKFKMLQCDHCHAWIYPSEYYGIGNNEKGASRCCARGRVNLSAKFNELQKHPELLKDLLKYSDPKYKGDKNYGEKFKQSKKYFENIKFYNNELAFGSISIDSKEDVGWGVDKINGLITYNMSGMQPPGGQLLRHGQVYTLDTDDAMAVRGNRVADLSDKMNPELVRKLHEMIVEVNPLAKLYNTAGDVIKTIDQSSIADIRLHIVSARDAKKEGVLPPPDLHKHSVETPDHGLIGSVWISDGKDDPPADGVVVRGIQGKLESLAYWNWNLDAIMFPLLFPYGQQMFHFGIPLDSTKEDPTKTFGSKEEKLALDDEEDTGIIIKDLPDKLKPTKARKFVSQRQYHRYLLSLRGDSPHSEHWLWSYGARLAQLYILTVANRIEKTEFDYIKKNVQKDLMVTLPETFKRALLARALKEDPELPLSTTLGKIFMAPAYIKGSRRFYQSEYANFMTICRARGQPDLFVTLTIDPDCPEVADLLPPGETWMSRPDLLNLAFEQKVKQLLYLMVERSAFGAVAGYVGAYEHQNRGNVHLHMLFILQRENNNIFGKDDWKPVTLDGAEYIKEYIQCEIPPEPELGDPDYAQKKRYRDIVTKHYIHTCGGKCVDNPQGKCRYSYPKPFSQVDCVMDNTYPRYRRRPPAISDAEKADKLIHPELYGETCEKWERKKNVVFDNSRCVPHNRVAAMLIGGHINYEFVGTDKTVEYCLKYVTKGPSITFVKASKADASGKAGVINYDQFHEIHATQMRTPAEAHRRIYSLPVTIASDSVVVLPLHLPNTNYMLFDPEKIDAAAEEYKKDGELPDDVSKALDKNRTSMLTAFIDLCGEDSFAAGLKYSTVIRYYRYDKKGNEWIRRKQNKPHEALTRIWPSSPRNIEHYALRSLVMNFTGDKLREAWNDNIKNGTKFLDIAQREGFIESDLVWEEAISAFVNTRESKSKLYDFFSLLLINGKPKDPLALITKFQQDFFAPGALSDAEKLENVLLQIEKCLRRHGVRPDDADRSACEQFGLPKADKYQEGTLDQAVSNYYFSKYVGDDGEEDDTNVSAAKKTTWDAHFQEHHKKLNAEQLSFFEKVKKAIEADPKDYSVQRLFFLYGEGGTGKTFTYEDINSWCKTNKRHIINTASTGIAAQLLYGGNTVHSTFFVTNDVDSSTEPKLSRSTHTAEILRKAEIIIIDEISCLDNAVLGYVDKLFRFLYKGQTRAEYPFANKIFILGGDWKQIMPVAKDDYEQFMKSVKNHPLFQHFEVHRLVQNMRL